jgi:lipoate-protein ligase A
VDRRKIGGTGAARMGSADVVVGSLMFAFDKKTMAKVLKVSSEKMRDKIFESLEHYMTTVEDEIGKAPPRDAMIATYLGKCAGVLGADIVPGTWTPAEETMADEWDARFLTDAWLYQRGSLPSRGVKIHEDVRVVESSFKASGGLIRVTARIHDDIIEDLTFSGDFTIFPSTSLSALEHAVRGARATEDSVVARLAGVFLDLRIQSPGVTAQDFAKAISKAIDSRM